MPDSQPIIDQADALTRALMADVVALQPHLDEHPAYRARMRADAVLIAAIAGWRTPDQD